MDEKMFDVLRGVYQGVDNIRRTSQNAVTNIIPSLEVKTLQRSYLTELKDGFQGLYYILLHQDKTVIGDIFTLSIRYDIYVDGQLSASKSNSLYMSIPRLLLAVLEILPPVIEERVSKEISKYILGILNSASAVTNRNTRYSTVLLSSLRQSVGNLVSLRECIKLYAMNEENLSFTLSSQEKFNSNVYQLLEMCTEFI